MRGCGGIGRKWRHGAWAAAAAAFALAACAKPMSKPEIIGGGDKTVTIQAGQWSNVDGAASKHCESYGRRAVLRGRTRLSGTEMSNLYTYDCVPGRK